jgi:hypothetical protein
VRLWVNRITAGAPRDWMHTPGWYSGPSWPASTLMRPTCPQPLLQSLKFPRQLVNHPFRIGRVHCNPKAPDPASCWQRVLQKTASSNSDCASACPSFGDCNGFVAPLQSASHLMGHYAFSQAVRIQQHMVCTLPRPKCLSVRRQPLQQWLQPAAHHSTLSYQKSQSSQK